MTRIPVSATPPCRVVSRTQKDGDGGSTAVLEAFSSVAVVVRRGGGGACCSAGAVLSLAAVGVDALCEAMDGIRFYKSWSQMIVTLSLLLLQSDEVCGGNER